MRPSRLTVIVALVVAVTLLGTGVAYAAWVKAGSGAGAAAATSLVQPSLTATRSTTAPTSAIVLSWTAAGQLGGASYEVRRNNANGAVVTGCTSSPCTDTGLTPGTSYTYVVTAKLGLWASTSAPATASTQALVTPAYSLSATPGTITAGGSTSVVITAKGTDGLTDTTYSGSKALAWSGTAYVASPGGTAPTAPGSVVFTNGVSAPVSVSLKYAGSGLVLAVSTGAITGSTAMTVSAAAATRLAMTSTTTTGSTGTNVPQACLFGCTIGSLGLARSMTTSVSVTDSLGNVVSNLASPITVSFVVSGGAVVPTTLTIPASPALATSTTSTTFTSSGSQQNSSFTASGSTYTQVTATIQKS